MPIELVKLDKDAGNVSVKLSVQGLVGWIYLFRSKKKNQQGAGVKDETVLKLGTPASLHMTSSVWRVVVGRLSETPEKVQGTMVWEQGTGDNAKEVHRETFKTTLDENNEAEVFLGTVVYETTPAP